MPMLFCGLSAFPITPMEQHGRVLTDDLCRLLRRLVEARVDSVGLLGSTGSYMYLHRSERLRAIEAAKECLAGRTPLIVGIGALRTDEAQALARDAAKAGADGLLLAPVSYTPLTEKEVFQHFAAVAGATDLPLCIYHNPATTHFTFSPDLLQRLAGVANIVAVKNPGLPAGEIETSHRELRARLPARFAIGYSGDWLAADAILAGGAAWYSVIGGLLPTPTLELMRAAQAGDRAGTARLNDHFAPLWALFRELGSYRVVHALANELGLTRAEPPRPILPLGPDERQRALAALAALA